MLLFDAKDKNLREDCEKIGQFYLGKNEGNYEAAANEIERLHITNIVSFSDLTIIYLSRPGLLIGKRGENIEALQKILSSKSLRIVEINHINDLIIIDEPDSWNDEYDYGESDPPLLSDLDWQDDEFGPQSEDFGGNT